MLLLYFPIVLISSNVPIVYTKVDYWKTLQQRTDGPHEHTGGLSNNVLMDCMTVAYWMSPQQRTDRLHARTGGLSNNVPIDSMNVLEDSPSTYR